MIQVNWEGDHGEVIEEYTGPFHLIEPMISSAHGNTVCLRFIDPWGDTTFNQLQIPVLIAELESLLPQCKTPEAREQLDALIGFAKQDKGVHTYLKIYGD